MAREHLIWTLAERTGLPMLRLRAALDPAARGPDADAVRAALRATGWAGSATEALVRSWAIADDEAASAPRPAA